MDPVVFGCMFVIHAANLDNEFDVVSGIVEVIGDGLVVDEDVFAALESVNTNPGGSPALSTEGKAPLRFAISSSGCLSCPSVVSQCPARDQLLLMFFHEFSMGGQCVLVTVDAHRLFLAATFAPFACVFQFF